MLGLAFYFLFVATAIGGVAFLLNKLGQGQAARYSVEDAKAHLLAAHPDEIPDEVQQAGGSVLFALQKGRVGVVRSMGRFPLIEILSAADISALEMTDRGLKIRTTNYADPSIFLEIEATLPLKAWIEEKLSLTQV